jgi:hypothetical protein
MTVSRTFSLTLAASGAPSWFTNLTEKRWTAIPGVNTLTSVKHSVDLSNGGYAFLNSFFYACATWNGGTVDQDRGELLLAASGGHNGYAGNEVYALRLTTSTPQWYRVCDPTPGTHIFPRPYNESGTNPVSTGNLKTTQGHDPAGFAAMYLDGRMRANHNWCCYVAHNGKIWYAFQASPSGAGNSTGHAWSFNLGHTGLARAPGQTPLAWADNEGPWTWLGSSPAQGGGTNVAPPAALDPVTGRVWCAHGTTSQRRWGYIDTSTGTITRTSEWGYANTSGQDGLWAVVVTDPQDRWRFFVAPLVDAGLPGGGGIQTLDLKAANPLATAAWTTRTTNNVTAIANAGLGAVYHEPSRSILLYNYATGTTTPNGALLKIRVPTNGDGTFNASGQWTVTTINPASGSTTPPTNPGGAQGTGAWSKFNIVNDMGNGQACLVVVADVTGLTYAYRLPTTEIT